jgi:radical SAM superfamily enzyme YgiQ (UPF0313 family)
MNSIPIYKSDGRPQVKRLESLPLLDRSLIDYDKYHKFVGHAGRKYHMAMQATRGCPYRCFYCDIYKTTLNHFRRSADHIFDEVRQLADLGVRRIEFIDDIFNVNEKECVKFFELILKHKLDIEFFFPTGLQGALLSHDMIDLMVEGGTIGANLSLEHPSDRLQKVMRKNQDIPKFLDNVQYITSKYPFFVLGMNAMHGFPTETEEEAYETLNFIKKIKWIHFPFLFTVRIFPGTELEQFALEQGVDQELINEAQDLPFEDHSPTIPFSERFTNRIRTIFIREYILSKERLLHILPHQMRLFSEDELNQKYNGYFLNKIKTLDDLLKLVKIDRSELETQKCLDESKIEIPDLKKKIEAKYPATVKKQSNALRLMLIDLSTYFASGTTTREYDVIEPPLGLMALLTYLNQEFGDRIDGKIFKSRIDYNSFDELRDLVNDYKPDIIGVRALSYYRSFFHETIDSMRKNGISVPIVAGGPYPTASPDDVLQDRNIDLVVLGEGELTLAEIVEKTLLNNNCFPDIEVLKKVPGIALAENTVEALQGNTSDLVGV